MPGTGQCYVCDVINIIIDFTIFAEQVLCARHYSRNIVHSCEKLGPRLCPLGPHILMKKTGKRQIDLERNDVRDKWYPR